MGSGYSVQKGGNHAFITSTPPPAGPRPPRLGPALLPGNRLTGSAPLGLFPGLQWKKALGASTEGRDGHPVSDRLRH